MSHLRFCRAILLRNFIARQNRAYATAHVATATNRITNMASSDSDDDILMSSLVLVSSIANQKHTLNQRAQKKKQKIYWNSFTICVLSL